LVLCLHGFLDQGAAWAKVAEKISGQGYHFVAPDARGHGRSGHAPPGSDYHFPDYLSDLDGLIAQLEPTSLRLIGHSMGGTIATLYAGLRPEIVDVLAIAEGLGPPAEKPTDLPDKIQLHLDQLLNLKPHRVMESVEAAAERLRRMTPSLDEDFAVFLANRSTEAVEGGVKWTWDKLHRTRMPTVFLVEGYVETLRRITAPTTLVYGSESWYRFPDLPDREAAVAQLSRHEIQAGHSLHIDAPEALAEIFIDAFSGSPK